MFKLKGTDEERFQKAQQFKEALMSLPANIECLLGMEVGVNCNPEEKWDIVLTALVDNMEALSEYARHPLHLEAASIIKDCKEERSCVDYIL